MCDNNSNLTKKKGTDWREVDKPTFIAVTPAFNEERNIEATIDSMISQIVKPQLWVIVDDGSTDETWEIIRAAAKAHPWIRAYRRLRRRSRYNDGLLVASEAEAFLEGLKLALDSCLDPEFIVKLDADLKFASDYLKALFDEYERNPKLGIAGGVIYECRGPDLVRDKTSTAHVRGATKVYRNACYHDIGGVQPVFGWDVIDEILARASGWQVASFDHIHLVHLRRTASRGGRFAGWTRNGYMAYYIGMSPFRMLLRAAFRLLTEGDVVQASGLAYGYFSNLFMGAKRLPNPELRKLVRQHQWVTAQASLRNRKVVASR